MLCRSMQLTGIQGTLGMLAGSSGFAGREPLLLNTKPLTGDANKRMVMAAGLQVVSGENLIHSVFPVVGSVLCFFCCVGLGCFLDSVREIL